MKTQISSCSKLMTSLVNKQILYARTLPLFGKNISIQALDFKSKEVFYIYVKRGFWGKNPRNSCRTAYNRKIDVIQSLVNNPGTAL